MYLRNQNGDNYDIPVSTWRYMLKLAEQFGWQPVGTQPDAGYLKQRARDPDGGFDQRMADELISRWNGTYMTQDHQRVTYADALNMAFALEEALKESNVNKEHIAEFVAFCKRGSFQIT